MIMADIVKWLLIFLGIILTVISYWLVAIALMPGVVERSRLHMSAKPIRSIIAGALIAIPIMILGGILANDANLPPVKIIGLVALFGPVLMGLLGSSGLAERVGIGLPAPNDDAQPWRRVLRGGIVLTLAFLLPLVGTSLFLVSLLAGVGGFVHAVMRRPKPSVPSEPTSLPEASAA